VVLACGPLCLPPIMEPLGEAVVSVVSVTQGDNADIPIEKLIS
jgi:hypothetical protein